MRVRCLGIILTLASAAAAYAPVLSRVGRPRVIMMSGGEDEVRRASAAENNASAAVGLLAASGAGISTIAATAAGVCAGGACAVGAGAGAPAAAAAVGGFNAWIAGGLVAAATFLGMPTGVPTPTSSVVEYRTGGVDYKIDASLAAMIERATPPENIRGKPVVIEFFRPACPRCNRLAPSLLATEEQAKSEGVAWTMINVDDPSAFGLIRTLGVSQLPHFSFVTSEGKTLASMAGGVKAEDVSSGVSMLLGRYVFPD